MSGVRHILLKLSDDDFAIAIAVKTLMRKNSWEDCFMDLILQEQKILTPTKEDFD